jgi:hypothetical protein
MRDFLKKEVKMIDKKEVFVYLIIFLLVVPVFSSGFENDIAEYEYLNIDDIAEFDYLDEGVVIDGNAELDYLNEGVVFVDGDASDGADDYFYVEIDNFSNDVFSLGVFSSNSDEIIGSSDETAEEEIKATVNISTSKQLLRTGENISIGVSVNSSSVSSLNATIKIDSIAGSGQSFEYNILSFPYSLTLDLTQPAKYRINVSLRSSEGKIVASDTATFSVYKIMLSAPLESDYGKEVDVVVNISAPGETINFAILDYGEGQNSNIDFASYNQPALNHIFKYGYNAPGNYTIKLNSMISGGSPIIIQRDITIRSVNDTQAPSITLINPAASEEIRNSTIDFVYRASDNVLVANCTFNLYNESSSGVFTKMNVSSVNRNIENGKEYNLTYTKFNSGKYLWEIECFDNSSNKNSAQRGFSVNITDGENFNYEKKADVENIIATINKFLEDEKKFGIDEKKAVEDLGIMNDIDFYKRRILQIEQDLKYNFRFISDPALKEKNKKEMLEEIDEMKSKVVVGIRVVEKKEFVKNRIELNIEGFVNDYILSKNMVLRGAALKKLIQYNREIQGKINVESNIKKIEIDYMEGEEKLTLVTRSININDNRLSKIFEIYPEKLAEKDVVFIGGGSLNGNYAEFSYSNLNDKRMVYYIRGFKDNSYIEKIETILFEDRVPEDFVKITGMSIFDFGSGGGIYYGIFIFLLAVLVAFGFFVRKKIQLSRWRDEPNFLRILEFISQAKGCIRYNDIEGAREKYHKIKEIYPLIPAESKSYLFEKIREMQIEIDKRDIFNLVREYEEAKRNFLREDSMRLYSEIQRVYMRLPKKYREIVYRKVFRGY